MPVRIPMRLPAAFAGDDDRALLARFADHRDDAAFAALVGRHARMVYGVCRRAVRDAHLAEDAFQAVFLVLARNPGGAATAASVGGWLFGVARRVGLAARRHDDRARRAATTRSPVSSDPDFDDLLRVLDEELAALPESYRAPLVACFLEERTQDEAAKQLGWSLSTLRRRLDRGKELLRARLTRRGATLAGGLFAGALAPSARAAAPPRLADPSPLAAALASEVARGSVAAKVGLAVVALAIGLGGLGFGWAADARPAPPDRPTVVPPESVVAPAPRAAWGTLSGRVVFPGGREVPEPRPVLGPKDADFFGPAGTVLHGDAVIDPATRGVANAVVWLRPDTDDRKAAFPADSIHPRFAAAKPADHLVQTGRGGFTPRVVAARAGDRVTFGNPTPIPFNVNYQDNGGGHESRMLNVILPTGKTHATAALPALPAPDVIRDNIHPWVKGYVWAFDHPYFAVTDSAGNFEIRDAPAGTWRLVVWHEKVGYLGGAKGRTGERLTVAGGRLTLAPRELAGDGWDE